MKRNFKNFEANTPKIKINDKTTSSLLRTVPRAASSAASQHSKIKREEKCPDAESVNLSLFSLESEELHAINKEKYGKSKFVSRFETYMNRRSMNKTSFFLMPKYVHQIIYSGIQLNEPRKH